MSLLVSLDRDPGVIINIDHVHVEIGESLCPQYFPELVDYIDWNARIIFLPKNGKKKEDLICDEKVREFLQKLKDEMGFIEI